MFDTIRNHVSFALWFVARIAFICLMCVGVYGAYRLVSALPEGSAAQGKVKLRLLDYERDTTPVIVPPVVVIRDDRTPPVATASCNTGCAPHPSCPCENTTPAPQQPGGAIQIVSINTMPTVSANAPAPRPVVNPNPAPKPIEATCGGR